jgi:hypothetical protein
MLFLDGRWLEYRLLAHAAEFSLDVPGRESCKNKGIYHHALLALGLRVRCMLNIFVEARFGKVLVRVTTRHYCGYPTAILSRCA